MLTPAVTAYVDDPPNLVGAKKIHSPTRISAATRAATNVRERMRIGRPLNLVGLVIAHAFPVGRDAVQPSGARGLSIGPQRQSRR